MRVFIRMCYVSSVPELQRHLHDLYHTPPSALVYIRYIIRLANFRTIFLDFSVA